MVSSTQSLKAHKSHHLGLIYIWAPPTRKSGRAPARPGTLAAAAPFLRPPPRPFPRCPPGSPGLRGVHSQLSFRGWARRQPPVGPTQWRCRGPEAASGTALLAPQVSSAHAGASGGSVTQRKSTETAGVPPHQALRRPTGRASPHARRGRRDQSASDVPLPIGGPGRAAHTPSTPRADWLRAPPVGPGGRAGARGKKVGRPPSPRTLLSPRAPGLPGRSASFLLSSSRLGFRARRTLRPAGVPRALTGGRGRQSAGGRVPARACAGESAGPAARGGRRVYRAAAAAAEEQLPASS